MTNSYKDFKNRAKLTLDEAKQTLIDLENKPLKLFQTKEGRKLDQKVHLLSNEDGTYSIFCHVDYTPCYYCMLQEDDARGNPSINPVLFNPDAEEFDIMLAFEEQGLSKQEASDKFRDVLANAHILNRELPEDKIRYWYKKLDEQRTSLANSNRKTRY